MATPEDDGAAAAEGVGVAKPEDDGVALSDAAIGERFKRAQEQLQLPWFGMGGFPRTPT